MKLISCYTYDKKIGGDKAMSDIEKIAQKCNIKTETLIVNKRKTNKIYKYIIKLRKILIIIKNALYKDLLIIQHPFFNVKFLKFLKNKAVLIHDISGLQLSNPEKLKKEIDFFKSCNYIIAHNNKMKQFLISNGIEEKKIIELELFDYLVDCNLKEQKINKCPQIVYSGFLVKNKAPFIYKLEQEKMNFILNLYGIGLEENALSNDKIRYFGSYGPLELPNNIKGSLGLVWDGELDESDENTGFKNYTKYNNPHKISCYIAAGIPVIVWKKAAIAELVNKYDIGYTISSIYDINRLNFSSYYNKKQNVETLSNKVKKGLFVEKALKKIIEEQYNKTD